MSKPEDDEPLDDRTVFQPQPPATSPPSPAPRKRKPAAEKPPEKKAAAPKAAQRTSTSARGSRAPGVTASGVRRGVGSAAGMLQAGTLLNNIYEVRRFIARGGMGEVYEGFNVNTDERVAIKVMLPHLAADAKVQAMFRKEARILTELAHVALVRYRVLAQEPELELFYIVTEYIDGQPLSSLVGELKPTVDQLKMLTRRLAEGLEAAHSMGAIHRDMSPDNVLLPQGRLEHAKIIDFGIAKDLDPAEQTVIGTGFAGKLGYVAPEQFGDFERRIGAWTDIYSLGLVILALAGGRAPDMGNTLVEAVDRRRAGPDLGAVPPALKPVFSRMLAANPSDRFQSMGDVIVALDAVRADDGAGEPAPRANALGGFFSGLRGQPAAAAAPATNAGVSSPPRPATAPPQAKSAPPKSTPPKSSPPKPAPPAKLAPPPAKPPKPPGGAPGAAPEAPAKGSKALLLGGGAVALLLVIGLAVVFWPKSKPAQTASVPTAVGTTALPELARRAVETAIPQIPCSWLDIDAADTAGSALRIKVSGAAAEPVGVNNAVAQALKQAGGSGDVQTDTGSVETVQPAACSVLDALRERRESRPNSARGLTALQPSFEMNTGVQGCPSGSWARPVVTIAPRSPSEDFSLLSISPSGKIEQAFRDRANMLELGGRYPGLIQDMGGSYRYSACRRDPGMSALVMVQGKGPFDLGLPSRGRSWPADFGKRFAELARERGWTTQMVWYRVSNDQPDVPEAKLPSTTPVKGAGEPTSTLPESAAPAAEIASAAPPAEAAAVAAAAPAKAAVPAQPEKGVDACWRAVGGGWSHIGYASRGGCMAQVFNGHCETTYGRWGKEQFRRYNGKIQAKGSGAFSAWRNAGPSECAAPAAEPPK